MFRRLLVANRGEIALRIARTCRRLGIQTVMVHSEADRGAPWLAAADRAFCVGPARSDASYLDQDAILAAAELTECQALHPGYGFLAENARFAARCEQQGLTFVGPPAAAIRLMGDKIEARRTLAAAGLTTIPGSPGAVRDVEEARHWAAAAGYPVLLKAAAGGGGKGLRRCENERELPAAFAAAEREAQGAFGDGTLYVERLVAGARHVEFQVLVDGYGTALHLGERDCSIQRHHQKLLEESPSPAIDAATRDELGRRTAAAVAGAGYRNAGTVEFLRAPDGAFYFMEMNARLQVEHPVTEMLTGLDLVEQQLAIAANRPLALAQADVRFAGHALELRINAEDPDAGFRPDPGTVRTVSTPPERLAGLAVRWDSAIRPGYRIPPYYDSMIGKLILHGPDRQAVLAGAPAALDALALTGVKSTIALHRRLLADPVFQSGSYTIDHLGRMLAARTV